MKYLPQSGEKIKEIALQIVRARKAKKAVILFTGAHLIKNGLGPILLDLIKMAYGNFDSL